MIRNILSALATRDLDIRAPLDVGNKGLALFFSSVAVNAEGGDEIRETVSEFLALVGISLTETAMNVAIVFAAYWLVPNFAKRPTDKKQRPGTATNAMAHEG